jgi:hypothetical protein
MGGNNYLKRSLLPAFLLVAVASSYAQNVGINTTGAVPSAHAILDLNTGNAGNTGLIVPNVQLTGALTTFSPPMTSAATTADTGLMIYNSDPTINPIGFYYWSGGAWVNATGASACGGATAQYIPYFTSSSGTVCNSIIYQTATNKIGINTITPQSRLDVKGSVTIGGAYAGVNAAPVGGLIVQGQTGIGTNTPDANAQLDVTSSTLGMLIPRMAAAPAGTTTSLFYYNTTSGCFQFYNGTAWQNMACGCSGPPAQPGVITGATPICASSTGNTYTIASVVSALSYTWTVPASVGTITNGQGTLTVTITAAAAGGSGTIDVVANNACGSGPSRTLTVTVNPLPTAPVITSTYTFACPGQAGLTYSVPNVAGYTYAWSVPAAVGTITAGGTTTLCTITAANPGGIGNVQCIESNACGAGPAGTFHVETDGHGSQTFNYTGSEKFWPVPSCVTTITITAAGGTGGDALSQGGNGAEITTNSINVVATDTIFFVAGGAGSNSGWGAGGGGASFAWKSEIIPALPLVAAGGGGGGGGTTPAGFAGSTTIAANNNAQDGAGGNSATGTGGTHGAGVAYGGGGAGWTGNGTPAVTAAHLGQGGFDPANGFAGGSGATSGNEPGGPGGFGGGGGGGSASSFAPYGGGGGGGGWCGGGGANGANTIASEYGGGGGGSGIINAAGTAIISAPAAQANQNNTGAGFITINW